MIKKIVFASLAAVALAAAVASPASAQRRTCLGDPTCGPTASERAEDDRRNAQAAREYDRAHPPGRNNCPSSGPCSMSAK